MCEMKMSESNEIASTWLDVKESTECFDAIELLYYSHSSAAAPEQQYTRSTTNYRQQNESNDVSNSSRSRRSCSSNEKHRKFTVCEWVCVRCTPFVPSQSSCRATVGHFDDNDGDHDHDDGFTSVAHLSFFASLCVLVLLLLAFFTSFSVRIFFTSFIRFDACEWAVSARVSFSHGMDFRWPYIHGNSTHKPLCLCRAIMRLLVCSFTPCYVLR